MCLLKKKKAISQKENNFLELRSVKGRQFSMQLNKEKRKFELFNGRIINNDK